MKILCIFGLLAAIASLSHARAEYYTYEDRYGNRIYVDDLSRVPEELLSRAEIYNHIAEAAAPDFFHNDSGTDSELRPTEARKKLQNERRRLEAIKVKLNEEHESLVKENAELLEEQKTAVTPEQVRAVNEKAVNFNNRFKAYQEKKTAYQTQFDDFHKRISKVNANN